MQGLRSLGSSEEEEDAERAKMVGRRRAMRVGGIERRIMARGKGGDDQGR